MMDIINEKVLSCEKYQKQEQICWIEMYLSDTGSGNAFIAERYQKWKYLFVRRGEVLEVEKKVTRRIYSME